MKFSIQAKELKATILDDNDQVVLNYEVENYKFEADMQGLINAALTLFLHAQTAGKKSNI